MPKTERALIFIVGFLVIAGIGSTVRFMLVGGANPGFEDYPGITLAHVGPALIYVTLAPLQFLESVRKNFPHFHRWSGRLLVLISLVLGLAAILIGLLFPFSGLPEQIVIAFFGTFFLSGVVQGFLCARRKQFKAHREWMMRAFAIGLAVVTMRLIFVPILIIIGSPTKEDAQLWSIVSFTIAFFLHCAIAEWWIRRTRTSG